MYSTQSDLRGGAARRQEKRGENGMKLFILCCGKDKTFPRNQIRNFSFRFVPVSEFCPSFLPSLA